MTDELITADHRRGHAAAELECCSNDIYVVACSASYFHHLASAEDKNTNEITVLMVV